MPNENKEIKVTSAWALSMSPTQNELGYEVTGYFPELLPTSVRDQIKIDKVIIPSEYQGLPVVAIAPQAFANCEFLNEVEVPNSIKFIGADAFSIGKCKIVLKGFNEKSDVYKDLLSWNCGNEVVL